tara:strand:+ start:3296 stop:3544 length:249 start_codon:yes stop_codon:yes gene_type:complete
MIWDPPSTGRKTSSDLSWLEVAPSIRTRLLRTRKRGLDKLPIMGIGFLRGPGGVLKTNAIRQFGRKGGHKGPSNPFDGRKGP